MLVHTFSRRVHGLAQDWDLAYINELSLFSASAPFRFDLPGTLNYHTATWMSRPDVRAALHVTDAPVAAWPGPPDGWSYESSYGACNDNAEPGAKSMVDFYREIAPQIAGKVVVYNGDTDPCVTYEGTRVAIERVGFDVVSCAYDPPRRVRDRCLSSNTAPGPLLEATRSGVAVPPVVLQLVGG